MAGVQKLQQMIECPVCNDIYTEPQILGCLHTVCNKCLDIIRSEEGEDFICPVCEQASSIEDIKPDINKEQLLQVCSTEQTPNVTKSAMSKLEEVDEEGANSETESDQHHGDGPKCELCDKRIAWFCSQCNQWFCNECKTRHVKTTATKYHKLEHLNDVAKKHRTKLEHHYFTFKRAHERLTKQIGNVDAELINSDTVLGAALFTTKEMRQEWIDRINHYFDSLDVKIADFANTRILDLKRLRDRLEGLQSELSKKTVFLSDYMTQYAGTIISTSADVLRDMTNFTTDTQVPNVEIKQFNVKVLKGKAFDGRQIATVEMFGGHTLSSAPMGPSSSDNHKIESKPTGRKVKHFEAYAKPRQKSSKNDDSFGSQGSVKNTPRRTPVPSRTTPVPKQSLRTPVQNTMATLEDLSRQPPKEEEQQQTAATKRVESLSVLTQGQQLRRSAEVLLTGRPGCVQMIDNTLWVAQDNCITLWNTELEEKRVIGHQLIKDINSVAVLKKGGYIVASDSGLHLFSRTYKYDGRVTDEQVSSVAAAKHLVFAAFFKEKVRVRINVYDERVPDWSTTRVIRTAIPGRATLLVMDEKLYVCSSVQGIVYVMTPEGEILKKLGKKGKFGSAGELNEPVLCHFDVENSILLCDTKDSNFQILKSDGNFASVALKDTITIPVGGCYFKRSLFVVEGGDNSKLVRYEA